MLRVILFAGGPRAATSVTLLNGVNTHKLNRTCLSIFDPPLLIFRAGVLLVDPCGIISSYSECPRIYTIEFLHSGPLHSCVRALCAATLGGFLALAPPLNRFLGFILALQLRISTSRLTSATG